MKSERNIPSGRSFVAYKGRSSLSIIDDG